MEKLLNDTCKFQKLNLNNDGILTFAVNQEKNFGNIFEKLVASNSISEETRRSFKPVGTSPAILSAIVSAILSAISASIHKFAKFLVLVLKSLISNEYTVKNSFAFAEEAVGPDLEFFMGNLDIDSLFTNILLEKTIEICANTIFETTEKDDGLSKIEFKELLSVATKEFSFIFNRKLYTQVDGVTLGSCIL